MGRVADPAIDAYITEHHEHLSAKQMANNLVINLSRVYNTAKRLKLALKPESLINEDSTPPPQNERIIGVYTQIPSKYGIVEECHNFKVNNFQ